MHPEQAPPQQRKQVLSPLMQAKAKATGGEKVNFCPFGCSDEKLDEHGYCNHLVGFTNDKKFFEPMVRVKRGRRLVRVKQAPTGEVIHDVDVDDDGNHVAVEEPVLRPVLEPVLKTDVLIQISVSWRVYRNTEQAKAPERSNGG